MEKDTPWSPNGREGSHRPNKPSRRSLAIVLIVILTICLTILRLYQTDVDTRIWMDEHIFGIKPEILLTKHPNDIEEPGVIWWADSDEARCDDNGNCIPYDEWKAFLTSPEYDPDRKPAEPTKRSELMRNGARVACWPRFGGVWIKNALPLELDFLGLSRFENVERQDPLADQAEEDEFCQRLIKVGAQWWELPPQFDLTGVMYCSPMDGCVEPNIRVDHGFGWPDGESGGACVLDLSNETVYGETVGGYYNAFTMKERCEVVMRLGGKWCAKAGDCVETERFI